MKRYFLLLVPILFVLNSCNKDDDQITDPGALDPVQEQWGFALNYTASWCGPCGDWGAPLIHDFADEGNVVAITAHASGDPMYKASLYNSFDSDRPVGNGIPSFYIGDQKSTNMNDLKDILNRIPIAGIAMNYTIDGITMTVNTKTEFFSGQSGIFHLSVLILESGIDGSSSAGEYEQNGVANPDSYKHDFVLRASSSQGNVYGEKIVTAPSKGDVIDGQYIIELSGTWNNDVYPIVLLWEKNSLDEPVFEFVNAFK